MTSGERHQAVGETAGEILSSQGGVVESLYGATQAIVDKAHKGAGMRQKPSLIIFLTHSLG